jgi:hypothetical protein
MTRGVTVALVIGATSVCGSALAAEDSESGVKGRVTAGPTCPVERYPPDPSCAPRPVETTIKIKSLPEREFVKTVRSGKKGYFSARLAPGRYRLIPRSGDPFPQCDKKDVTVSRDSFTRVHLSCDTGIR